MRRQHPAPKRSPKTWVVHVKIAGHNEQVEMSDDMTDDEARELFVSAAEISSRHILKLYTSGYPRQQHRICAGIAANTPDTRYTLEIACASLRAATTADKLGESDDDVVIVLPECVDRHAVRPSGALVQLTHRSRGAADGRAICDYTRAHVSVRDSVTVTNEKCPDPRNRKLKNTDEMAILERFLTQFRCEGVYSLLCLSASVFDFHRISTAKRIRI
jgi:hypothetical protein